LSPTFASSAARSADPAAGSSAATYVSVWAPFVRVIVGVVIIIAALVWSLHFTPNPSGVGYVAMMFAYLLMMIIGGGLMVAGATTLWSRLTSPDADIT
jgi:hypothetical protein